MEMTDYLNERCIPYIVDKEKWLLYEYDNWGADYGMVGEVKEGKLLVYACQDSGHSPLSLMFELDSNTYTTFLNCLYPTNPNCRTQ